jgi:hypothetical protein
MEQLEHWNSGTLEQLEQLKKMGQLEHLNTGTLEH